MSIHVPRRCALSTSCRLGADRHCIPVLLAPSNRDAQNVDAKMGPSRNSPHLLTRTIEDSGETRTALETGCPGIYTNIDRENNECQNSPGEDISPPAPGIAA